MAWTTASVLRSLHDRIEALTPHGQFGADDRFNVSIGTIFSIRKRAEVGCEATPEDFLKPGSEQVCAGYAVYGSSTMFVYTTGDGVDGFTLDPGVGEFVLSHPDMRIPDKVTCLSVNSTNRKNWYPETCAFVDHISSGNLKGL